MSDEEFDLVKREGLTSEAQVCYDREKSHRIPGWHYEPPGPDVRYAEFLALEKKRKRRHTINWIVLILFFVGVVGFVLQIPNEYSSVRLYLCWTATIAMMASTYRMLNSTRRTGYAVLWLRRFHRRQQKPFQRALERACMFVGMPLTIQDSSFRFSMGFALGRLEKYLWYFLLALVVGVLIAPRIGVDILGITIFISMMIAMGTAYWWAFLRLRKSDPLSDVATFLTDIRTGRIRNFGTLILRCGDSFWRTAVELAMRRADVIVIDVSEPSANVIWELQTAAATREPESILLTCAVKDTTLQQLREVLKAQLHPVVNDLPLDRCRIFFYPEKAGYFGQYKIPWKDLQEALVGCLRYAPAHDDVELA